MMAGLLVMLTILAAVRSCTHWNASLRAAAWGALAMGLGGSMTYGQTIGLTQDQPLIGNWDAWRWGMLGLSLKGGLWIALSGLFFGMGWSSVHYRTRELILLLLTLIFCFFGGILLFNRPFDPTQRILPWIYFSDDWFWEPNANLKPRPEVWGGYALALIVLLLYTRGFKGDRAAVRMALFGLLGGAIGFPLGQCLQSAHAWNFTAIQASSWSEWDHRMNWWNWMETTFGAVMGMTLAIGARTLPFPSRTTLLPSSSAPTPLWQHILAMLLITLHVACILFFDFAQLPAEHRLTSFQHQGQAWYDHGVILIFLPMVAVSLSRYASLAVLLPGIAIPIAAKTYRELVSKSGEWNSEFGFIVLLAIPLGVALSVMLWWQFTLRRHAPENLRPVEASPDSPPIPPSAPILHSLFPACLLVVVWIYYLLNLAQFRLPWPWEPWTTRTPNNLFYTFATLALTFFAIRQMRSSASPTQTE